MESQALKPNLQDLQQNVVELLGQASSLMHRASTALSSDSASEKFAKFQQEINNAARNVEDFELRMAIVAPMKAGKSTIINAIIGQELLPSRNSAMTTIPTEIIFDAERTEPMLALNTDIRQVFQEAFLSLQGQIRELGMQRVQEKLGQYPHLIKLAEKIEAKTGGVIDEEILGRQRIINNLGALNDIVRLCSIIEPIIDPLALLTDVPRIYTPFWLAQSNEQSDLLGKLVIVDTPGPNEAGQNLRLVNVVSEQLERCSLVLFVLDFTQLRTEAAEKVKKDVQKVINLRGNDNLYVLINKVDQRRLGDMTPEQVRQFVAAELEISDPENRVFEIAARRAFGAANFMQEMEQNLNVPLTQMQTARALAQEVFGIDWEEELEAVTISDLLQKAQRLWNKSGFAPFLENAIKALMAEAAPRSIISALNMTHARLGELQEDVQLRSSAIYQDEENLRLEIAALEEDLHSIDLCRDRLQEVEQIKAKLYEELNKFLEDLKKETKLNVESYFNEEENGTHSKIQWSQKDKSSPIEFKRKAIREFRTLIEAEEFADIAVSYAKDKANIMLEKIPEKINAQIDLSREQLTFILERETKPIMERARTRLNQNFNVDLSLLTPKLDKSEIDFTKPRVKRHTRVLGQGYQEKSVMNRRWWYWFGIIPKQETIKVKIPDQREAYYTVSLQEIITEVNQLIEQNIKKMKQEINQYLDADFQQRIDEFFDNLDRYLSNYCESLKQAQLDQQLSIDQKEKLVSELLALVPNAIAHIKQAETYLEYTKQLR